MELATGIGRYPCEHIIDSLSALEKDADKKICDSLTFENGDLEVDATAVRRFFVSKRNPNYQSHIQKFVESKKKPCPDVMRCHARVLGICEKGRLYCFENFALSNRKRTEFRQLRTHRRL